MTCASECLINSSGPRGTATSRLANRPAPEWASRSQRESSKHTKEESGSSLLRVAEERVSRLRCRPAMKTKRAIMSDQPRILVVDDEPQLARVLSTGLQSQ